MLLLCGWFLVWGVPSGWQLETKTSTEGEDGQPCVTNVLNLLPWQKRIKPSTKKLPQTCCTVSKIQFWLFAAIFVGLMLGQMLQNSMSEFVFTLLLLSSFVIVVATLVKWGFQWLLWYQFTNAQVINRSPVIHNKPGQLWDTLMPDKVGDLSNAINL